MSRVKTEPDRGDVVECGSGFSPMTARHEDRRSAAGMKAIPAGQQDWSYQNADGTYAAKAPNRIGNASLERVYRMLDGSVSTIQLVNKLSDRPPGMHQWPEFCLKLSGAVKGDLLAPDFELTDIALEGGPRPGNVSLHHAGPPVKQVLGEYVTKNKVNYLKCDYLVFACEDPSHGHGIGPAGREAQIDGLMDIFRHVKTPRPRLPYRHNHRRVAEPLVAAVADYIWLGGSDGGELKEVKNLTPQDSGISYRDSIMYEDFMDKQYAFPYWGLMTHGFWEWGGPSFEKFQDDVMMVIARGIAKYEILNSPSTMDDKRFAFLGKAIRWGKANWDILADTRMILGDPRKAEVYGYSHVGAERGHRLRPQPATSKAERGPDLHRARHRRPTAACARPSR